MAKQKYSKIIGLVIIVAVLIVAIVITSQKGTSGKKLSLDEAKTYSLDFINGYLLDGEKAEISEISKYNSGLYKMKVKLAGVAEDIDSYLTVDGKIFFPQAVDIDKMKGENKDNSKDENAKKDTTVEAPKKDKPEVELFVMAYCPYGTQIEKGIIPVVQTLKDKIDFKLKFVDYAMHGEKELKENLTQYCIEGEQGSKYIPYLSCFLEAGDSASCLKKVGIDQKKLNSCTTATDKKFKVMELYADKSTWQGGHYPQFNINKAENDKYGVGGSPTLVINGKEVASPRDSAGLLKTICATFTTAPTECSTKLSSDSPAPGFGAAKASNNAANSGATCN